MPQTMGAAKLMYIVTIVNIVSTAHILDNLQTGSDRNDLGRMLHFVGKLLNITFEADRYPIVVTDLCLFFDDGAEFPKALSNIVDGVLTVAFG